MSNLLYLSNFINKRRTAAGVFKQTVTKEEEKEEIDLEQRLLDIILKPKVKLHRICK